MDIRKNEVNTFAFTLWVVAWPVGLPAAFEPSSMTLIECVIYFSLDIWRGTTRAGAEVYKSVIFEAGTQDLLQRSRNKRSWGDGLENPSLFIP